MMQWLDRLNLQPHERRWLLIGLVLLAGVLNYWLVWPYFGEWNQISTDQQKLVDSRTRYLLEINKKAGYEKRLKDLQKVGAEVLQEDQANRLQSTLISQASATGVQASNFRPLVTSARVAGQTNAFFDEQQMTFDVNADEAELVGFLHALGASDSMIRVRDISRLRLDPSQTRLTAQITVVASFQKKPKPVSKPPVVSTNRPAAKPATKSEPAKTAVPPPTTPSGTNSRPASPKT